jgi:hypothetical protein
MVIVEAEQFRTLPARIAIRARLQCANAESF